MELWLESKNKTLIDAIIHAYPDKNDLERIVQFELNEKLDTIAGGENITQIVFNLITKWAIPRGKTEQLFQACYQDRPANPKLKELEKQYQNDEKKEGIINILQMYFKVEENTIFDTYEIYISQVRKLNARQPKNLKEIINELDMPIQGDYSHIEKFVGYLSLRHTNTSLASELRQWGERNIINFGELLQQLIQQSQLQEKREPCLMLAISKSGDNYVVEAWFIKDLMQYNREFYSDCEQLMIDSKIVISTDKNLSDLPEIIINLINQSSKKAGDLIEYIHIFLPSELMNYDFDCWKSQECKEGDEDFSTSICEDYKVVVRCSDRLRGENPLILKWRKKARILKDKLEEYANNVFVVGSTNNQKTLFEQVKQEHIIAVKITTVLEKKDVLGKIIFNSALPLALWTRQEIPDIEQEFNKILNDIYLKELPAHFKSKKERREQNINHLCLLWDDPDLLPPQQLLTQNKL